MIILVIGFFAAMLLPALQKMKTHDQRNACVNNLKQVGLADRIWEGDHSDKFPMHIPGTNGGTMNFMSGTNAFRHFQVLSNELVVPRVLLCPAESDWSRFGATNFAEFNNYNLSYFVGLDATDTNADDILSGDHNLNGALVKNGILELSAKSSASWTGKMHKRIGNIVLGDGSVQQTSTRGLQTAVANTGLATNRLQMPILGP